jgi:hypothetical protein
MTFLLYSAAILLGLVLATLIVWGFRIGGRFRNIAAIATAVLLLGALYTPSTEMVDAYRSYKAFEARNVELHILNPMAHWGNC